MMVSSLRTKLFRTDPSTADGMEKDSEKGFRKSIANDLVRGEREGSGVWLSNGSRWQT